MKINKLNFKFTTIKVTKELRRLINECETPLEKILTLSNEGLIKRKEYNNRALWEFENEYTKDLFLSVVEFEDGISVDKLMPILDKELHLSLAPLVWDPERILINRDHMYIVSDITNVSDSTSWSIGRIMHEIYYAVEETMLMDYKEHEKIDLMQKICFEPHDIYPWMKIDIKNDVYAVYAFSKNLLTNIPARADRLEDLQEAEEIESPDLPVSRVVKVDGGLKLIPDTIKVGKSIGQQVNISFKTSETDKSSNEINEKAKDIINYVDEERLKNLKSEIDKVAEEFIFDPKITFESAPLIKEEDIDLMAKVLESKIYKIREGVKKPSFEGVQAQLPLSGVLNRGLDTMIVKYINDHRESKLNKDLLEQADCPILKGLIARSRRVLMGKLIADSIKECPEDIDSIVVDTVGKDSDGDYPVVSITDARDLLDSRKEAKEKVNLDQIDHLSNKINKINTEIEKKMETSNMYGIFKFRGYYLGIDDVKELNEKIKEKDNLAWNEMYPECIKDYDQYKNTILTEKDMEELTKAGKVFRAGKVFKSDK